MFSNPLWMKKLYDVGLLININTIVNTNKGKL